MRRISISAISYTVSIISIKKLSALKKVDELLSRKEENPAICNNVDEPRGRYDKMK